MHGKSQDLPYLAFLRSRWPARTRGLALRAFAGSLLLAGLDWAFARAMDLPLDPGAIAAARLPWLVLPVLGFLLLQVAPASRLLPPAVVALSVCWTWGNSWAYVALGLEGTVLQSIALFAWLVTAAIFLPVTGRVRVLVFGLMWLGHLALSLLGPPVTSLTLRLGNEAVVLAFAILQIVVFQAFATSQRRGVLLRRRLERAVVALDQSRQHAADAVGEVGRLAAAVAHDVNNPLSAVKVNVRWLGSDSAVSEPAAERAEVVGDTLEAVERIARIVADLKLRAAEKDQKVHQALPSEETTAVRRMAGDSESG